MAASSTALASTEESPAYSPRERSNTLRSFESSKTVVKATKIKEITDIPAKIKKLRDKYYNVTYQSSSKLVKAFTSWEID